MSATTSDYDSLADLRHRYFAEIMGQLCPADRVDKETIDLVNEMVDRDLGLDEQAQPIASPDSGFLDLLGLGANAPARLGAIPTTRGVKDFDDDLTSDRILSAADLYYLCIHERIGIFQVIAKLLELFKAGTLRIGSGAGALELYRFDKQGVLRYPPSERLRAYKRVFGYGPGSPGPGA